MARTIRKLLSGRIQHDYCGRGVRARIKKGDCALRCVALRVRGEAASNARNARVRKKKKEKVNDTRAALLVIFPAFVACLS